MTKRSWSENWYTKLSGNDIIFDPVTDFIIDNCFESMIVYSLLQ